jgi:hypothetical protein
VVQQAPVLTHITRACAPTHLITCEEREASQGRVMEDYDEWMREEEPLSAQQLADKVRTSVRAHAQTGCMHVLVAHQPAMATRLPAVAPAVSCRCGQRVPG